MEKEGDNVMYDYATVTMQNRILGQLQDINNNLLVYNETVTYLLILIIIVLMSFGIYKLVMSCLGK